MNMDVYGIVDAEVRTVRQQEPISFVAKQGGVAVQSARKCRTQQKWSEKPSVENIFRGRKAPSTGRQMSGTPSREKLESNSETVPTSLWGTMDGSTSLCSLRNDKWFHYYPLLVFPLVHAIDRSRWGPHTGATSWQHTWARMLSIYPPVSLSANRSRFRSMSYVMYLYIHLFIYWISCMYLTLIS